ncbi:MAG: hypothetical protein [Inoviridae sp.]|nr:MAG: hypothetical protein [Inoviridae sp.]
MIIYMGEILKVENNDGFKTITFEAERYDRGLNKNVPCSEQVIITDECEHFWSNYQKHIGETVSISVSAVPKKKGGGVWFLTQSDVLDPASVLTA